MKAHKNKIIYAVVIVIVIIGIFYFLGLFTQTGVSLSLLSSKAEYDSTQSETDSNKDTIADDQVFLFKNPSTISILTAPKHHIETPKEVRAVYLSGWGAGSDPILNKTLALFDAKTVLNSVVIDVKDSTGEMTYEPTDPLLKSIQTSAKKSNDFQKVIDKFHQRGVYIIGRVTVFQDSYAAKKKPEWSYKDTNGQPWTDKKGLGWLDSQNKDVWEYVAKIALDAYALGVDEINFDYIRLPSDGFIYTIKNYPTSETERVNRINNFFTFLDKKFHDGPIKIPISADIFGSTATQPDDLGIGQKMEIALDHFDYIAPMIYPSHFPKGFLGIVNPADKPYEIIKIATLDSLKKIELGKEKGFTRGQLRPWLQDFNLGAVYGEDKIHAQIDALHDQGVNSYMFWNPSSNYKQNAYLQP